MKKISAIFSVLAVAVIAIVTMGCPVAYEVSNPMASDNITISTINATDTAAAHVGLVGTTDLDLLAALNGAMQFGTVPTSVTFNYTVTSASNWNFDGCVYLTGPLVTNNYNLVATLPANWWAISYGNIPNPYFVVGGVGTDFATNVGGTQLACTANAGAQGGDILEYSGSADLAIDATAYATNGTITFNYVGTPNGSGNGPSGTAGAEGDHFNMKVAVTMVLINY